MEKFSVVISYTLDNWVDIIVYRSWWFDFKEDRIELNTNVCFDKGSIGFINMKLNQS